MFRFVLALALVLAVLLMLATSAVACPAQSRAPQACQPVAPMPSACQPVNACMPVAVYATVWYRLEGRPVLSFLERVADRVRNRPRLFFVYR